MTLAKTLFGAALGVSITLVLLLVLPLSGLTAYDAWGLPRTVGHSFEGGALTALDWFAATAAGSWMAASICHRRIGFWVGMGAFVVSMITGLLGSSIPMDSMMSSGLLVAIALGGVVGFSIAHARDRIAATDGSGAGSGSNDWEGGGDIFSSRFESHSGGWGGGDSGGWSDGGGDGGGGD